MKIKSKQLIKNPLAFPSLVTKPDHPASGSEANSCWGTWEELILAFAVNRHGTASWESIASELQKRTSHPNLSLTPHNCRSKYLAIKRRFLTPPNHDSADHSTAPLLDELRKLRVAELRRQVERYDLNIESLEMKVKRMEEEREMSLRERSESDLETKSEDEKRDVDTAADPASVDGVAKDQLSVNESNSTDPEADKSKTGERGSEPSGTEAGEVGQDQTGKPRQEPVGSKPEPDRKSGRDNSCNGSSNSIEKSDRNAKKESVTDSAESDGGGETGKENSDVQSTASRSRNDEGGDKVRRRRNTSGDERDHEEDQLLSAQSQPLFDFLQAIGSHKLASIFQRRLRSQDTSKYKKLILQHMDLESVEKKVRQGRYIGSQAKFFRDLLLLVNNALVFFPNNSPEFNAAREMRTLVSKEISPNMNMPVLQSPKDEQPADPCSNSIVLKPRLPLAVCRKRSSITSNASDKKKDQALSLMDGPDELKITKKCFLSTKKNGKNNSDDNNCTNTKQQLKGGELSSEQKKKRGAANFLSRMKQGSNSGDLLDALKKMPLTGGEGSSSKGDEPTEDNNKKSTKQMTRRSTTEARLLLASPGKRNVGRPPKRGVPPPAAGKRGRDKSENDTLPKKRMRKL